MISPAFECSSAFAAGLAHVEQAKNYFDQAKGFEGMHNLVSRLGETRRALPSHEWANFISVVRDDAIRDVVHLCPMTLRSYVKPRGYAGDAVMLDHIYGLGEAATYYAHPSTLRGQVYAYTVNAPAPRAVRYRRALIAKLIDEVAATRSDGNARVLAIASGHLREAELSRAVQLGSLAELSAMDQDLESTSLVDEVYGHLGVTAIDGSVRDLIRGRKVFAGYDFVYAAGLFDYLDTAIARRLAEVMLEAARPGGKILIANFTPETPDAGFMEAFMDWFLVYRTKHELEALFGNVLEHVGAIEIFDDPAKNVAYAVITRA